MLSQPASVYALVSHPRGGVISAQPAVALSVDIITPETDPYEIRQYQRRYFEAVCRDAKGNDVTDRAAFSWDFDDGSEPDRDNPALHHWINTGKYKVTVTATLEDARIMESPGTDTMTVEVTPGVQTRQAPGAGDFSFYATPIEDRDYTFGSTVCDAVVLICRACDSGTDPYDPWCILSIVFERNIDGQWHLFQGYSELIEIAGEEYEASTHDWTTFDGFKNIAYTWRAKVTMWDSNYPPDPEFFPEAFSEFYVPGTGGTDWTPDNTIVKATGDDLIIHHADDTSHTISYNITHLDYDNPTFTVDVDICSLLGGVITTLTDENATIGGGSIDWDTNLPEENGIYTYKITAEHNLEPAQGPPGLCVDTDKVDIIDVSMESSSFDVRTLTLSCLVELSATSEISGGTVRVYDPDLTEVTSRQVTSFEGSIWEFFQVTVEPDHGGKPYYFVFYANEADGSNNRDMLPKLSLPKGAVKMIPRPKITALSGRSSYFDQAAAHALDSMSQYLSEPKYQTVDCANDREAALAALETSAVFAFYGHGCSEWVVVNQPSCPENRVTTDDVSEANLDRLLVVLWVGCHTAEPNGGYEMTTQSVSDIEGTGEPRAESAVGWEESISYAAMITYSDIFWDRFAGAEQENVDDATYNAAWDAWFYTGDEGILSYRVEGDYSVTLTPTRWSD
ncbi:MAG: PKD domain-containing protein [Armatimonadota bacterium]